MHSRYQIIIDFPDADSVSLNLRVKADFSDIFFAFTEGDLRAEELLGERYKVVPVSLSTGTFLHSCPCTL
jgi:hypothetical protein